MRDTAGEVMRTHGHVNIGRPAKTYIHQLCMDTGCSLEDLLRAMDDRERGRERERGGGIDSVRELRAISSTMITTYLVCWKFIEAS